MARLWKIRALIGHWVGKVITLVMLVAIVLGVAYSLKNVLPVWKIVEDLMSGGNGGAWLP